MKQFVLIVAALVSSTVLAQEIGTEITPTTPNSGVQQQQQQPQNPPPAEQNKGYVYKPKGSESATAGTPNAGGPKASAGAGDFGIRAGFGTSGQLPSLTATSAAPLAAPSIGIAYFAGDAFKLLVDLGFGLLLNSNASFSMNATVGFDYLFRTPSEAMRPFFHFAGSFLLGANGNNIGLGAQIGFGAEYFFAPQFGVNARLLLAVPMSVNNGFLLGLFTFQPGVGATWYL